MDTFFTGNKGDLWNPTSKTNRTLCPCPTPSTLWISSLKQYPSTMNARQYLNKFHLGCRWFWVKITKKRARPTSQSSTGRQVQSHQRLRWKTVHWNITTMLLIKSHGTAIHDRIFTCITPFISTQKIKMTTRFAIPLDPIYKICHIIHKKIYSGYILFSAVVPGWIPIPSIAHGGWGTAPSDTCHNRKPDHPKTLGHKILFQSILIIFW